MLFGLKEKNIQAVHTVLERYPQVDRAILFGSRAKGSNHIGSDIDLTLEGHNLTLSILFKIENELDDLLIPYKIDLSILHTIENPAVLEHIARVGKVFYDSTNYKNKN